MWVDSKEYNPNYGTNFVDIPIAKSLKTMSLYEELQTYLQRTASSERQNLIRAAQAILSRSASTGSTSSAAKLERKDEERELREWAKQQNCWIKPPNQDLYVAEGAEQKVFFMSDRQTVIKFNRGVFYEYWKDYLLNLLLHNFFFPSTSYKLIGFSEMELELCAVVEQHFVQSNQETDLEQVRLFLETNGFKNTRNHDYYNSDLKVILLYPMIFLSV
ncbi:MAG: hypothetical protein JJT94_06930 [Bernardetiaceae bacterium]|nr:hypothetical protein [Bernardetiaceae bacterium]